MVKKPSSVSVSEMPDNLDMSKIEVQYVMQSQRNTHQSVTSKGGRNGTRNSMTIVYRLIMGMRHRQLSSFNCPILTWCK